MMSWPYTHLLINHFPVVLSVAALAATILALLLGRRGLWLTAMAALTAAGLFVYPVFFSGNEADHALNDPWYIKHGTIEAHDAAATWTLWVILLVGVFAAYSWWRSLKRPAEGIPGWMRAGVVIGSLLAVSTVARTAFLGGKIIHESPVLQLKDAPAGLPPAVVTELRGDTTAGH
ncbi:MAG TPA: DUF2231 domain-containing protein [Gemmatimonadaceae bacterium]|nr:DUF2231 domain-containing protein [Gemmatimonadaceae bacterium]